ASLIDVTLGIRSGAEHAVGVENVAKDAGDAFDVIAVLRSAHGENGIVEGRFRPEIERRMSVEDLETAHQQHEEDQRIDPVRDPPRARMAIDDLAFAHGFLLPLTTRPAIQSRVATLDARDQIQQLHKASAHIGGPPPGHSASVSTERAGPSQPATVGAS